MLWLDASELPPGPVARWADKSGHHNHVVQGEAAHQPAALEHALRQRTAVRLAGDDFLERAPLDGFAQGDQPFHAFFVMQAEMDGNSPNPRLMDLYSSKENRRGFWVGYQNSGRNRLGISNGDEGEAASKAWDGQPHLIEAVYRGEQRWEQFLDGEFDGGGEYTQREFEGFAGPVALTLGQHHDYRGANTYYRGDLAEVIVFNRALGNREQREVGRMLAKKYGLAARYNVEVIGATGLIGEKDRAHWAWQRLAQPPRPEVRGEALTPVDAFILARLEAAGLSFAAPALRPLLARRLALDLTGLPLAPNQLKEYLADDSPIATENLVDRLLASPRFGERWGRHWLDAAGYVDVLGVDNDAGTIKLSPGKWRYRDWVIRAFNEDKPFDRFLTEQLSGDEQCDWRDAEEFTPEMVNLLVATTFLRAAADDTNEPEINTTGYHQHGIWFKKLRAR